MLKHLFLVSVVGVFPLEEPPEHNQPVDNPQTMATTSRRLIIKLPTKVTPIQTVDSRQGISTKPTESEVKEDKDSPEKNRGDNHRGEVVIPDNERTDKDAGLGMRFNVMANYNYGKNNSVAFSCKSCYKFLVIPIKFAVLYFKGLL